MLVGLQKFLAPCFVPYLRLHRCAPCCLRWRLGLGCLLCLRVRPGGPPNSGKESARAPVFRRARFPGEELTGMRQASQGLL